MSERAGWVDPDQPGPALARLLSCGLLLPSTGRERSQRVVAVRAGPFGGPGVRPDVGFHCVDAALPALPEEPSGRPDALPFPPGGLRPRARPADGVVGACSTSLQFVANGRELVEPPLGGGGPFVQREVDPNDVELRAQLGGQPGELGGHPFDDQVRGDPVPEPPLQRRQGDVAHALDQPPSNPTARSSNAQIRSTAWSTATWVGARNSTR